MKIKMILVVLIVMSLTLYSQSDDKKKSTRHSKKYEQLEKIKLLEILNLDEESSIKFFVRRNQSREKIHQLINDLNTVYSELETLLETEKESKSKYYDLLIEKALSIDKKIIEEKYYSLKSLSDILTKEQIAKVILFDRNFKKDVRNLLLERGRKKILEKKQ